MQREEYAKGVAAKDASALKIGVVVSRFNEDITEALLEAALETLKEWKVKEKNISVVHVSGSFEIPFGCLTLLKKKKLDAVVALGCVIKGDTTHDQYIANAVSNGIMELTIKHGVPISFGIITTNNLEQAVERSTGETNKGREAAVAAMESGLIAKGSSRRQ